MSISIQLKIKNIRNVPPSFSFLSFSFSFSMLLLVLFSAVAARWGRQGRCQRGEAAGRNSGGERSICCWRWDGWSSEAESTRTFSATPPISGILCRPRRSRLADPCPPPVKSILRFRSLCKSWRAMVANTRFVRLLCKITLLCKNEKITMICAIFAYIYHSKIKNNRQFFLKKKYGIYKSKNICQKGEKKGNYFFPMIMTNSHLHLFFYDILKDKLNNSLWILHE